MKKIITILCFMFCLFGASINVRAYSARTSEPTKDNNYFYKNNVFQSSGYGMWNTAGSKQGNCTAYAWGRAYELLGKKPNLCTHNAGAWWNYNKSNKNYSYGSTPKLGAIAVWDKYDNNQGHVAVVEKISGNNVTISESHWKGVFFDTRTIKADSSNYLKSMRFLGYIYIGDFEDVKPSSPKISQAVVNGTNSVTIKWNKVNNVDQYRIDRRISGKDTAYETIKTVSASEGSYVDNSLKAGSHYYYRVYAKNSAGWSDKTDGYGIYTLPDKPAFKVQAQNTTSINVSWNAVQGAVKYEVYRRLAGESYPDNPTYTTTKTSILDTKLEAGTRYWYRVYAINENNGKSNKPDGVMCYTYPNQPTVKVTAIDKNSLSASWNKVKGASYYTVNIRKSGDEEYKNVGKTTSNTYSITNLYVGTKYYVRVYAVIEDNDSYISKLTSEKPAGIEGITKSEATTEKKMATTEKKTEATTEKKTEATTEKKTEATTEKKIEATTEKKAEATTEKKTEITTEKKTEATTEKKTESTTEKKEEATTEKKAEITTEKKTETTINEEEEATTEKKTGVTTESEKEETDNNIDYIVKGTENIIKHYTSENDSEESEEVDMSEDEVYVVKPRIKTVKNTKKGTITIKLSTNDADGYEYTIAKVTNKTFSKFKKAVKNAGDGRIVYNSSKNHTSKSTVVKMSRLKKGKKYAVVVRAYKIVDSVKYYSEYSSVKSVKIKK